MAIRGPQGQSPEVGAQQAGAKPLREQAASPIQRLLDFGAARTPQEAKKLVAELLATLRAAGFPVSAVGSVEGQLGSALKLFQESRGLPPTGTLDDKTRDALTDLGHLPPPPKEDANASVGQRRDAPVRMEVELRPRADPRLGTGELTMHAPLGGEGRPDGTKSTQVVELQQLTERVALDKPPDVSLKSFLSSLRAAGFAGSGAGAAQLKDGLRKMQKAEGLPQSGQLDARTAAALVKRGILDERSLPLTMVSADHNRAAPSADARPAPRPAASSDTRDMPSRDIRAHGTTAGAEGSAGRPDRLEERSLGAHAAGERGAPLTDGAGAQRDAQGTGSVDDPWREGMDGNAPAGDDDALDQRRGHANVDDSFDGPPGHWQVPALSEQIAKGLLAIVRDDDGKGAATYAWEFTLHRPGIYGAKQPAEKLFRLVVTKASAFDALWEDARGALNEKLAVLEPEAARIEPEVVARALRVARMKER